MHHPKKLCEGATSLDSFVENSSQYLRRKFERDPVFVCVLYCHFWAEIISTVRHMYVRRSPKWTVLPASACYSQRGEWAAFTLSCSHSFGLILNISGSKTETRKAEFSCFIFVCNLQMLFLPFQKDWYTKKQKKKEEVYSDLCGLWQLFEYNRGCFYKLVVH